MIVDSSLTFVPFRRRGLVILLLFGWLATTLGCALQENSTVPVFHTPIFHQAEQLRNSQSVRRLVMIGLENRTGNRLASADMIQQQFSNALRSCGTYEVVNVPRHQYPTCNVDAISRGEFSERLLVELHHKYNADAVVIASINEYQAYGSLALGITAHVVDVRNARVLASIDGVWGSDNQLTRRAFEQYLARRELNEYSRSIRTRSPALFSEFVMSEISAHLKRGQSPKPIPKSLPRKTNGAQNGFTNSRRRECRPNRLFDLSQLREWWEE